MTPKQKKSKLPIIIVLVAAVVISLAGGVMLGKYAQNSHGMLNNSFNNIIEKNEGLNNEGKGDIFEIKPLPETSDTGYATTEIYKKVNPSVVSINVYANSSISPIGAGTGIVMTADGYILTNAHVVAGGSSVNVIFSDGSQSYGTIIGADADTDLAVVKVEKTGLTPAEFGDSSQLEIGERVVAIGNAGGLSSTLTQGVISGLDRDLNQGGRSLQLIQVDAAINPGNSGGPLINRFGQVIGINSSKIADVEFEGIGFSIPATQALPIVQSIIDYGYVAGRAALGVSVAALNQSNGPMNGLPSKGLYIAQIQDNSDLRAKGVRERDVIVEANGKEMLATNDLLKELESFSPGDSIKLKIYRAETNNTFEVSVTLVEAK